MAISKIRFRCVGLVLASLLFGFRTAGGHANPSYPLPENGAVANGVYRNPYFDLRYPVPAGWREDVQGPAPSVTAYYSLAAFISAGEHNAGTLLIAAQDNFFSPERSGSALGFVAQMREHLDPSLSAPAPSSTQQLAGQPFARLDYNGAGLYHAIFAVEVRCHTLIFSFTSASPQWLQSAVATLNGLTLGPTQGPTCVRDYAMGDTVLHRANPRMVGPRFSSVPVRIAIGPDGTVEHVHAIAGFPEQIQSVTAAMAQWRFKPFLLNGKRVAVETGLLFRFEQAPSAQ